MEENARSKFDFRPVNAEKLQERAATRRRSRRRSLSPRFSEVMREYRLTERMTAINLVHPKTNKLRSGLSAARWSSSCHFATRKWETPMMASTSWPPRQLHSGPCFPVRGPGSHRRNCSFTSHKRPSRDLIANIRELRRGKSALSGSNSSTITSNVGIQDGARWPQMKTGARQCARTQTPESQTVLKYNPETSFRAIADSPPSLGQKSFLQLCENAQIHPQNRP